MRLLLSTITFNWTSKMEGLGSKMLCVAGGNTATSVVSADSAADVTDDDACAVFVSFSCTDWRRRICLLSSNFSCFAKNSVQSASHPLSLTVLKWTVHDVMLAQWKKSNLLLTDSEFHFILLQHRHGTVCHQRLGHAPHLRHFGGRPSLPFPSSYGWLALSVSTVGRRLRSAVQRFWI